MQNKRTHLFALSLLLAAGCAFAQKTVVLGGDDNYSTQNLRIGDKIVVKLRYDRASGFAWQPAALEAGVLQEDAVKPKAAPGVQAFEFTAAGPGVTTLTLNNVKKADPGHPMQVYSVMVGVSSPPGQAKSTYVVGHYVGPLPCQDCEGIEVDLTLYAHAANQFVDTIYKRTQKHQGKTTVDSDAGTWVLLPGTAADPSATVYALSPDGGGAVQYFWQKSDEELVPLDSDKKPLAAPMDITLHIVK